MAVAQYYGTGRRKTSVARVRLVPGQGNITVNKKELTEYFGRKTLELVIKQPLVLTGVTELTLRVVARPVRLALSVTVSAAHFSKSMLISVSPSKRLVFLHVIRVKKNAVNMVLRKLVKLPSSANVNIRVYFHKPMQQTNRMNKQFMRFFYV